MFDASIMWHKKKSDPTRPNPIQLNPTHGLNQPMSVSGLIYRMISLRSKFKMRNSICCNRTGVRKFERGSHGPEQTPLVSR